MRTGRRGFETSRSPAATLLSSYGRAATVSGASASGPAPGDVFNADYSSLLGNWSSFRFDSGKEHARTHSLLVGGGPRGLNAFEIALTPGAAVDEFHTGRDITLSNYADGTWRYYRWYDYHVAGNNYHALDGEGRMIYKRFLGGSNGSGPRFIMNFTGERDLNPYIGASLDGGPFYNTEGDVRQSRAVWTAIQLGVRFGSSAQYVLWINNDDFNSPTHASTPASRTNTQPGYIVLGFYSNDGLQSDGVFTMRDAAFRASTSFDSNWYGWMNG